MLWFPKKIWKEGKYEEKLLAVIITSLLLSFSFGANYVSAACPGMHPYYVNAVSSVSNYRGSHQFNYPNMFDGNGNPITGWCSFDAEVVVYYIVCGACYTTISAPYSQTRTYNHTACGQ